MSGHSRRSRSCRGFPRSPAPPAPARAPRRTDGPFGCSSQPVADFSVSLSSWPSARPFAFCPGWGCHRVAACAGEQAALCCGFSFLRRRGVAVGRMDRSAACAQRGPSGWGGKPPSFAAGCSRAVTVSLPSSPLGGRHHETCRRLATPCLPVQVLRAPRASSAHLLGAGMAPAVFKVGARCSVTHKRQGSKAGAGGRRWARCSALLRPADGQRLGRCDRGSPDDSTAGHTRGQAEGVGFDEATCRLMTVTRHLICRGGRWCGPRGLLFPPRGLCAASCSFGVVGFLWARAACPLVLPPLLTHTSHMELRPPLFAAPTPGSPLL